MAKGGARPGAGRKKGHKASHTLEALKAREYVIERIKNALQPIMDAQIALARGCSYLYRIDKDDDGKKQKPVLVIDPKEIATYLDGEFGDGDVGENKSYYYITTEKPENPAIKDMLDRAFGRAKESVDLTSKGEQVGVIYLPPKRNDPESGLEPDAEAN